MRRSPHVRRWGRLLNSDFLCKNGHIPRSFKSWLQRYSLENIFNKKALLKRQNGFCKRRRRDPSIPPTLSNPPTPLIIPENYDSHADTPKLNKFNVCFEDASRYTVTCVNWTLLRFLGIHLVMKSRNSEVRLTASRADSASLAASQKFARYHLYIIHGLRAY